MFRNKRNCCAANYNCPGQLVISGTNKGIEIACEKLILAGAKRAIKLPVGGAFHSPLMDSARKELEEAIYATKFTEGICPIYQNVTAKAITSPKVIKENLNKQLTSIRIMDTKYASNDFRWCY